MEKSKIKRLRELSLPRVEGILYLELTKEYIELLCEALRELEQNAESCSQQLKGVGSGMKFTVIDTKTGKEPNCEGIALYEEWAKELIYCDIEGFYIGEDGQLILVDECGHIAYCPDGRFKVEFEEK